MSRRTIACLFALSAIAVTAAPAAAATACPGAESVPASANARQGVVATLCLLNAKRADVGVGPLSENDALDRAALAHTRDMLHNQYFDHTSPAGSSLESRLTHVGYIAPTIAWSIGENLGWGDGTAATPAGMVDAWMRSSGHRTNILDPAFHEIGFGIVPGSPVPDSQSPVTYTTDFGYHATGGTGLARSAGHAHGRRRHGRHRHRRHR